jgi:very-short-patch-repair endonuclease
LPFENAKTKNDPTPSNSDAAAKLSRSRDLLLDLTLRNRLLNFPQGDPDFKERDDRLHKNLPLLANVESVWTRLVVEGTSAQIHPSPEDPSADGVANLIANGDLCSQAEAEHLEKRLQKLFREHQTLESSTGDSAFFLAMGFLEWQEPPPKDTRFFFAPLLLLHVRLLRKNSPNGGKRSFVLQMDSDQYSGNPSLCEKLKMEHNLLLPSSEEIESPETYLREVESAIRSMPKWKVHRSAAIGFFNFARYRLWLDLDEAQWPTGCSPAQHPIVSDLVDQKWRGNASAMPTESEIAEHQEEHDLPVVLEADGTQYAALMAAGRGQSLVIIGPPGSGKSQTITNLIAVSLAHGKRVLFIAQKRAALEVVQRLLREVGMSAFCLPLHSDYAKPLDVHQQLRAAGAEHRHRSPRLRDTGHNSNGLARLLNDVAGRLGRCPDGYQESVASLIQRACATRARAKAVVGSAWDDALLEIEIPDGAPTRTWFEEREQCLRELIKLRADAGQHWQGWRPLKLFAMDPQKVESALRTVVDAASIALERLHSLPLGPSVLSIDRLTQVTDQLERLPLPPQLVQTLLRYLWLATDRQQEVHQLERSLKEYYRQRDKAAAALEVPADNRAAFAQKIVGASGILVERLSPITTIENAKLMLADLALALDLVGDLVSLAKLYPTGVESLQDAGKAELTFRLMNRLASNSDRPGGEMPPGVQIHLARHIVKYPESLKDAFNLASQLGRAHSLANRVEHDFADLILLSPEARRDAFSAVSVLTVSGLGAVQLADMPDLRKAISDHNALLASLITQFQSPAEALSRMASALTAESCRQLAKRRASWTRQLIEPPAAVHKAAIRSLTSGAVSPQEISHWCDVCESAGREAEAARQILTRATTENTAPAEISKLKRFRLGGANDATVAEVSRTAKRCRDTVQCIDRGLQYFTVIAKALGQSPPAVLGDFDRLARFADSLRSMPSLPSGGFLEAISSAANVNRVRTMMANCFATIEARGKLANRISFEDLPSREKLSPLVRSLRSHQTGLFRSLRPTYRATRRSISRFVRPPKFSDDEAIAFLDDLESLLGQEEAVNSDQTMISLLGPTFKGLDTNLEGVVEVLDWATSFYATLGDRPIPLRHLARVRQQAGEKLTRAPVIIQQFYAHYGSLKSESVWLTAVAEWRLFPSQETREATNILSLRQLLSGASATFESLAASFTALGCNTNTHLGEAWKAIAQIEQSRARFDGLSRMEELLQAPAQTVEISSLRATIEWFRANVEEQFPRVLLDTLAEQSLFTVRSVLKAIETCGRWVTSDDHLKSIAPEVCNGNSLMDQQRELSELLGVLDRPEPRPGALTAEGVTLRDLQNMLSNLEEVEQVRQSASSWTTILAEDPWRADVIRIGHTATWVRALLDAGTTPRLISWCLEAETGPRFLWYHRLVSSATDVRRTLDRLLQSGVVLSAEITEDTLLYLWHETNVKHYATLAESTDLLKSHAVSGTNTLKDISASAVAMLHSCELADELADWEARIGTAPTALTPTQVSAHREWVSSTKSIPTELRSWLMEGDPSKKFGAVMDAKGKLYGLHAAVEQLLNVMESFGPIAGSGPEQIADTTLGIEDLRARILQLQKMMPRLLPWANLLRAESQIMELGLESLADAARRASMSTEAVVLAFEAAVSFQQAKSAWQADPRLRSFRGSEFDQLRARFADADQNQLQKNRLRVGDQIVERAKSTDTTVNDRRCVAPEMYAVLAHEENKQRKHWPIRKLVEQTGPLMQQLCPCWLMTPLGVAQFLKPGAVEFDIVIMDEASQLPPEDAWGAIARGKQLVVVGDPKQMPPSDFFSSASGEDDESDDDLELDGAKLDSILDTAKNCMRQTDLLWHYRSKHQSLIAPANRFSYGDRLVLFPSAHDIHPEMGIRHTFVPDAVATTGRVVNSKEAVAIVDRLIQIAHNEQSKPAKDRLSVGVVAMNAPQMDCIQELLDTRRMTSRSIDMAISSLEENAAEPLLVMNLENVQGDQRDVILISYTYAPNTPGGTPTNRFGPITLDGGERRFNVLITRAKWRMEVFASIRSDQIQISGKRPGVHHFYYFLKYAESGKLVEPGTGTARSPDSPFEEHVIAVLKSAGYEVQPQVGVAGYFIDIAVRDPTDRERFILGIECDGATYHSSKAARDRDRLREQVLRDRGWKLYRIWSTDWFTNHEAAKEDLLAAVARICAGDLGEP